MVAEYKDSHKDSSDRIFFLATIIYLMGIVFLAFFGNSFERQKIISFIDTRLGMAIDASYYIIPSGYVDRAVAPKKEGDFPKSVTEKEYNKIGKDLTDYADMTSIYYLYALVYDEKDNAFYEIATSATIGNDPESYYYFKATDDYLGGNMYADLVPMYKNQTSETFVKGMYDLKFWGYGRYACKKEISPKKRVYFLCADYSIDRISGYLRTAGIELFCALLILILISSPLFIVYKIQVNRHYKELEATVAKRTQDLSMALDRAEKAIHVKSEFLATMSHELRTPLNAIIGFSELIAKSKELGVNIDYTEYGKIILNSGRELLTLIEDILNLSKLEARQYELKCGEISLPSFMNEIKEWEKLYKNRNPVKISYLISPSMPKLYADISLLRQMLFNVMSNAVKFSRESPEAAVEVKIFLNDTKEIEFDVKDNGIGIAKEKIDMIFNPFVHNQEVFTKTYCGTGLGLTIVDRILKLHNARVMVDSTEGVGTTFRLIFPKERTIG